MAIIHAAGNRVTGIKTAVALACAASLKVEISRWQACSPGESTLNGKFSKLRYTLLVGGGNSFKSRSTVNSVIRS